MWFHVGLALILMKVGYSSRGMIHYTALVAYSAHSRSATDIILHTPFACLPQHALKLYMQNLTHNISVFHLNEVFAMLPAIPSPQHRPLDEP